MQTISNHLDAGKDTENLIVLGNIPDGKNFFSIQPFRPFFLALLSVQPFGSFFLSTLSVEPFGSFFLAALSTNVLLRCARPLGLIFGIPDEGLFEPMRV